MKLFWSILLSFTLLLSGCESINEPISEYEDIDYINKSLYEEYVEKRIDMEEHAENDDIPHIKWRYEGDQSNSATNEFWSDSRNLTETDDQENISKRFGCLVLSSYDEYVELISFVEDKQQRVKEEIGVYGYFKILVDSIEEEIDQEFFESHNLAVIDYCLEGSPFLRSRLDEVNPGFWGRNVRITISKEEIASSSADLPGEVYFIPVPKRCTILEVEYIETAWLRS